MPFKRMKTDPLETAAVIPLPQIPPSLQEAPAPQKLGALAANPLVADYRFPTIWVAIMERDYKEATDKLVEVLRNDFKLPPELTGAVTVMLPCIVNIQEGRTKREEESIRRVQKRMAHIYAGLIDRMFRYRPESRQYAVDWLKQELINWRGFYRPYSCEVFRAPATETEPKKKGKKK